MERLSFFKKIPRAVYYMDITTPLCSLLSLLFTKKISTNERVIEFETKIANETGASNAIAMPHARIALYYLLRSLKLPPGSKILMTPINIPDMVNMITCAGHRPSFVDLHDNSFSPGVTQIEQKVDDKTKVLFITILNGIVPDLKSIFETAKKKKLFLILDTTQAYGSRFEDKPLVEWCDALFFAVCDLKDIHTHMGGIISTGQNELAHTVRAISVRELAPLQRKYIWRFIVEDFIALILLNRALFSQFFYYGVVFINKLHPEAIARLTSGDGIKVCNIVLLKGLFGRSGFEKRATIPKEMLYQFSSRQAEIGLCSLKTAGEKLKKRKENAQLFLQKIKIPQQNLPLLHPSGKHTFWKFPIITERHRELQEYLLKWGIDSARSNLTALSHEKPFAEFNEETPVAKELRENSLYVPLHYYLTSNEVEFIAERINQFFIKEGKVE